MKMFSPSVHRFVLVFIALCTYPGLQVSGLPFPRAYIFLIILFLLLFISVILYPRGTFFTKSLLGTAVPLGILLLLLLNVRSEAFGLDVIIVLLALYISWLWLIIYSSIHPEKGAVFVVIVVMTVVAFGGQLLVYKTQKETDVRKKNVDQYMTVLRQIQSHDYDDPHSIFANCTQLARTAKDSGQSCAIELAQTENDMSWCDSIQDEADKLVSCYLPLTYNISLQDQINVCRSSRSILARDVCLRGIVSDRPNINEEDAQEVCSYSSEKCLIEWGWRKQREIVTR